MSSKEVERAFALAKHPNVVIEDFPGYDPQHNPAEWVWSWAKYGRLANLAANDGEELHEWAFDALAELKHRPELLDSFFHDAELPLAPYSER